MARICVGMALPLQIVLVVCFLIVSISNVANAQQIDRNSETKVSVPVFKSVVLELGEPASRVSVGNPDVADILILRASQLYVLGKDIGTTNVILWDRDDNLVGSVAVEVTHDLDNLREKLIQLLPSEPIKAHSVQRSIVLQGTVSSLVAMQAAMDIAGSYLAQVQTGTDAQVFEQEDQSRRADKSVGAIINLMQVAGAQQVMLEVKVAEIARTELKRLNAQFNAIGVGNKDWNFGGVNGGATFPNVDFAPFSITDPVSGAVTQFPGGTRPIFNQAAPWGPVIDEFAPNPMAILNQGIFASLLTNNTLFNLAIDAAKEKGLAKILAEPTLTTLTGQTAEFISGGEFPIPVPQGDRGITVEFRNFGVELKFLPVVLGSGVINLKLDIAVSELVNSNSLAITSDNATSAFIVPSLSKRSASVTVELQEGQTIAIAGLISENLREIVTKFPGLGNIPVLGALFRSQEFINNESELVIIVTPHLAKPLRDEDIILPTDNFIEPSDTDFYLFGRLEGRPQAASSGAGIAAVDTDEPQSAASIGASITAVDTDEPHSAASIGASIAAVDTDEPHSAPQVPAEPEQLETIGQYGHQLQ
ncbi:MAG: type II and III secretion system protein family protein [Gammaproteobacteria bacterium]|nr:type II and III secretion system protein family protein [Gammaproteobacteria bacterium]